MAVFGKKSIFANKWTSVHKQSNLYIRDMKQLSRMKQTAFAVACLLLLCGVADAQTSKKKGAGQRKNSKTDTASGSSWGTTSLPNSLTILWNPSQNLR